MKLLQLLVRIDMKILRYIRWYIHNSLPQERDSIRHPIRDIPQYRITELTEESYQELISLPHVFAYHEYSPKWETPKSILLEKLNRVNKYNYFGILDNNKFKLEEQLLELV
jgi:hypothetical protein